MLAMADRSGPIADLRPAAARKLRRRQLGAAGKLGPATSGAASMEHPGGIKQKQSQWAGRQAGGRSMLCVSLTRRRRCHHRPDRAAADWRHCRARLPHHLLQALPGWLLGLGLGFSGWGLKWAGRAAAGVHGMHARARRPPPTCRAHLPARRAAAAAARSPTRRATVTCCLARARGRRTPATTRRRCRTRATPLWSLGAWRRRATPWRSTASSSGTRTSRCGGGWGLRALGSAGGGLRVQRVGGGGQGGARMGAPSGWQPGAHTHRLPRRCPTCPPHRSGGPTTTTSRWR